MADRLTHLVRNGRKFARLALGVRARRPREVQLEVTNRCNLDCDMCPRLTLLQVPEVDMSRETFAAILERLDAPEQVTLTGWGEPLMHPHLFEFLDALHARFPRADLGFTTNGHLLTERVARRVLSGPVSRVNVSLEELPWEGTGDEASGERERPLAPAHDPKKGHGNSVASDGHPTPPKVVAHLRRFLELRRERAARGEPVPEVRLQVVLFAGSEATTLRLVDFAADLGFQAVNLVRLDVRGRPDLVRPTWEEERRLIRAARQRARERGVPLGSVNDHGALLRLASHGDRFCVRLDSYVYVDVEGNVAPCCLLRGVRLGNLVHQSLDEVWSSPAFKRFYGPGPHPACQGCDAFLHHYAQPEPAVAAAAPATTRESR